MQPLKALLQIALTPLADGLRTELELLGDGRVAQAIGVHQHQPRTPNEAMKQRTRGDDVLKLRAFVFYQDQRTFGAAQDHESSS